MHRLGNKAAKEHPQFLQQKLDEQGKELKKSQEDLAEERNHVRKLQQDLEKMKTAGKSLKTSKEKIEQQLLAAEVNQLCKPDKNIL